jgi:hypothetical protein
LFAERDQRGDEKEREGGNGEEGRVEKRERWRKERGQERENYFEESIAVAVFKSKMAPRCLPKALRAVARRSKDLT